jgi:hypothetical protein
MFTSSGSTNTNYNSIRRDTPLKLFIREKQETTKCILSANCGVAEMLKWMAHNEILSPAFRMSMKFTVFHNLTENWTE